MYGCIQYLLPLVPPAWPSSLPFLPRPAKRRRRVNDALDYPSMYISRQYFTSLALSHTHTHSVCDMKLDSVKADSFATGLLCNRTPLQQDSVATGLHATGLRCNRTPCNRTPLQQDSVATGLLCNRTPLQQDSFATGLLCNRTPCMLHGLSTHLYLFLSVMFILTAVCCDQHGSRTNAHRYTCMLHGLTSHLRLSSSGLFAFAAAFSAALASKSALRRSARRTGVGLRYITSVACRQEDLSILYLCMCVYKFAICSMCVVSLCP
jgi:hypothetical protein